MIAPMKISNLGASPSTVTASFTDLKLSGAHADKGEVKDKFEATVPSHRVVLVKTAK
jgi:hypothetical protein